MFFNRPLSSSFLLPVLAYSAMTLAVSALSMAQAGELGPEPSRAQTDQAPNQADTPPGDPCLPCDAVASGDSVIVDPGNGNGPIRQYDVTGVFFLQDQTLNVLPNSYKWNLLEQINQGLGPNITLSNFYPEHSTQRPGYMVFSGVETGVCRGEDCVEVVVRKVDFHGCRDMDRNPTACSRDSRCAYYSCSAQCHPQGTSACDAGCRQYCSNCRRHDGNRFGCLSDPACDYYTCSNQCHPQGTSSCFAGCKDSVGSCDCRALDGSYSGCQAVPGCSYNWTNRQCHVDF